VRTVWPEPRKSKKDTQEGRRADKADILQNERQHPVFTRLLPQMRKTSVGRSWFDGKSGIERHGGVAR
jgi:hypothetical protein